MMKTATTNPTTVLSVTRTTTVLTTTVKAACLLLLVNALLGCSSVRVSKQSITQNLVNQRNNIVTSSDFSDTTQASLRVAGVDKDRCLTYFDDCILQVANSIIEPNNKASLALFAELYYAKSKQLINSKQCKWKSKSKRLFNQPANKPANKVSSKLSNKLANNQSSSDVLQTSQKQIEKEQQKLDCLLAYQDNLNSAIRYSFAYLFYHELNNQASHSNNNDNTSTYIPNERDIQTLDIYQVASNQMISNLYKSSQQTNSIQKIQNTKLKTKNTSTSNTTDTTNTISAITSANQNKDLIQSAIEFSLDFASTDEIKTQLHQTDNHHRQVKVMQVNLPHSHIEVYIPTQLYLSSLKNSDKQATIELQNNLKNSIENLIPTSEIKQSGLNSISKRQGFGLSYIALLKNRYTNDIETFIKEADNNDNNDNNSNNDNGNIAKRIHGTGQALLSGYVQPTGSNIEQVLATRNFKVHLYNPYANDSVRILGQDYPLGANFSAGYALWLAENNLHTTGFANMLDTREKSTLPKLFMLEPYNPNKRVIIMIHGLASSPATWIGVTNDIFNDATLRENYQVWQVFYPTNIPMIENRYQIQKLIETAFRQVDPTGTDIASEHSVIISHSMGGILSRMMLSNNNLTTKLSQLTPSSSTSTPTSTKDVNEQDNAEQNLNTRKPDTKKLDSKTLNTKKLLLSAYSQDEVEERFQLHKLPQVDRVVFINAPFKGTDFADRWFTRALRRIIHLPVGITKTIYGNLSSIVKLEGLKDDPLGALFLQNGASQLSNRSSFMALTKDVKMDATVNYHTIIASQDDDIVKGIQAYQQVQGEGNGEDKKKSKDKSDNKSTNDPTNNRQQTTDNSQQLASIAPTRKVDVTKKLSHKLTKNMSDGIVPYTSSHLDGADSETIISGGHSIQKNPKTILVLRNILHKQLQTYPISVSVASAD